MARLSDLAPAHRLYVRRFPFARWATPPAAVAPAAIDLAQATLALVTTGGLHLPDQVPFDRSSRGGDVSFRELPGDADPATLRCSHRSDAFDHAGVDADPEVVFPLTVLRGLVARGVVKALAPVHLSYMGSITKPARLVAETAPAGAEVLVKAGVDATLIVPL